MHHLFSQTAGSVNRLLLFSRPSAPIPSVISHPTISTRQTLKSLAGMLLLTAVLFLGYTPTAQATHFRYGSVTWAPTTGRTIKFKLALSYRSGFFVTNYNFTPTVGAVSPSNVPVTFDFGDGTTTSRAASFTVTSVNTASGYFFAEASFTHTYTANGNFTAGHYDGARLGAPLVNNHDQNYGITTLVNVGSGNSSPSSSLVPIVNLAAGLTNATFLVPASDPNGSPVSFSLATAADLRLTTTQFTQPAGLSITSSGQVTFNTSDKTAGQYYNAVVKISDGTSFIVVDFLIQLVANTGTAPVFVYGGVTPANGSAIQGVVGAPISFTVRANDTDVGSTVTLNGSGLPPGSSFSPVTGTGTASSIFSLTPTVAGSSVLTFSAIDDIGKQTLTSVTLQICSPITPTLTASNNGVLTCLNPSLTLTAGGGSFYVLLGPGINQSGSATKATVTQAGTYTVVVSGGNSCPTSITTAVVSNTVVPQDVTVSPGPSGTLTCAQTSVLLTAASSTTGVSYVFSGTGITGQSSNTATVNQPGTFTVVGTGTNGCVASTTIVVSSNTALPNATISPSTATICAGQSATLTASGGGSYVWSDSQVSATISATATGAYSVTVTGTNGCSNTATASVTVNPLPTPVIVNLSNSFCQDATPLSLSGSPAGGTFTVDGTTATTLTPASLSVGQHTVAYSFTNNTGCSATTSQTVTINALPTLAITGLSAAYCKDATPVTLAATPAGGTFTIDETAATTLTPTSLSVGQHTVVYSFTNASQCSATTSQTVTINALPTLAITGLSAAYCKDATPVTLAATPAGGTFTVDGIVATTLTPASLSVGQHTVGYSFTNASQCSATTSQTVTINALPVLSITGLSAAYCKDATPITLAATPAGGGFTVDGTTATTLTPASLSVGQHTVGYSFTNLSQCSATTSQTVTINALPTLAITGLSAAYCKDATPVTLAATPAGGTFTVDGIVATTLTPASLSVGQHTVAYAFTNNTGCSATTSQTVTINALPVLSITGLSAAYCKDATPVTLAATPTDGVFTIDGTTATTLTPASLSVGQHTVGYSFTNASQCSATTSQTVTINALPVLSITGLSAAYCKDATPVTLASTPTGGVFTVDGITATTLTPASLSVGQHTVVYSFTNPSQCSATTSQTVTINALPVLSITGLSAAYCKDATPITLAATPAGGGFTVDGTATTTLTPASLSVGQHTVVYAFTNASQCSATTSQTVTINALPTLAITGLSAAYCKDATPVTLAATPTDGVFTIDGTTATTLTPASLSVGQHTVVYSFTNLSQCSATTSQTVTINALPTLAITGLSAAYCKDATPVTLAATPAGGTFTVDGIVATTLTPASLSVGQHTVAYAFTNNTGCSATTSQTVTINALPTLAITGLTSAFCQDATAVPLTGTPTGGVFTIDGTAATTLTPASLSVGQHAVAYAFTNNTGCSATTSQTVTVKEVPQAPGLVTQVGHSYPGGQANLTINQNVGNVILTITGCVGGTITWAGGNATTLAVATITTGVQTFTATCSQNGCTSPLTTATVTVMPTNFVVLQRDPDNGQLNTNTIKPYLQLQNDGSQPIPYGEITVRYWLTVENPVPLIYQINYAQLGSDKVHFNYVPLNPGSPGATGYIEYSFDASAGSLAAMSNSGPIQNSINKQDYSAFNQADDYSYVNNPNFTPNAHITAYRNGTIIWGQEPAPVTPMLSLKALVQNNTGPDANTINPVLDVLNDGNVPVNYSDLKVRYYFTADGTQPLNVAQIGYIALGNANVTAQLVTLSPPLINADRYLELSFSPALGSLTPGTNTNTIGYEIRKSDYSPFNQLNDYSYQGTGGQALNNRVVVYVAGQRVYGTEPGSGGRRAAERVDTPLEVLVLGNPISGSEMAVDVRGAEGQSLHVQLTDLTGRLVSEQQVERAGAVEHQSLPVRNQATGLLLLRVSTPTQSQTVKVLNR